MRSSPRSLSSERSGRWVCACAGLFVNAPERLVTAWRARAVKSSSSARALAARNLGALELSRELLEGALDILPARSDVAERDNLERALENELAEVLDELGRSTEAIDVWQEGRRWALATDNPGQLAYPLINLARVALEAGDRVQTEALMQQALDAAIASDSAPVLTDLLVPPVCSTTGSATPEGPAPGYGARCGSGTTAGNCSRCRS